MLESSAASAKRCWPHRCRVRSVGRGWPAFGSGHRLATEPGVQREWASAECEYCRGQSEQCDVRQDGVVRQAEQRQREQDERTGCGRTRQEAGDQQEAERDLGQSSADDPDAGIDRDERREIVFGDDAKPGAGLRSFSPSPRRTNVAPSPTRRMTGT